jgi:prepilin-type N-terminal cleavage/methylation domain-containing protein
MSHASRVPRHGPGAEARHSRARGFTIVETAIVVAIVAILAAMLHANYDRIVAAAEQALCAGNMRSLHHGLALYQQENRNIWPQGPLPDDEEAWTRFWLGALTNEGIQAKTWRCPTIARLTRSGGEEAPQVHYVPTMFTDQPGNAYRWPTQPWLIERAGVHGQGPLICFPDGSVKPLNKVLAEQGLR